MDKQRFIERMLETENLTDELEDAEAQWLLDWGISTLEPLLEGIEDAEDAGSKVNALMAVMRRLNRVIGNHSGRVDEELAADLKTLDELACAAFPQRSPAAVEECLDAARRLAQLDNRAALEFAAGWRSTGFPHINS